MPHLQVTDKQREKYKPTTNPTSLGTLLVQKINYKQLSAPQKNPNSFVAYYAPIVAPRKLFQRYSTSCAHAVVAIDKNQLLINSAPPTLQSTRDI